MPQEIPTTPKQPQEPLASPKPLLRVGEVATILDVGVSTIWRQVRNGQLPAPIQIGGSTRWRRAEIEAIIAAPQQAD
jgi:excisionase family DNA binding protein